mmetsp:Transcript_46541/g.76302  ORF Transcript_46541/g.76302 Transcript_46541/m.76302 type:complete len:611 (+) Transcript_46541:174-2006(+)
MARALEDARQHVWQVDVLPMLADDRGLGLHVRGDLGLRVRLHHLVVDGPLPRHHATDGALELGSRPPGGAAGQPTFVVFVLLHVGNVGAAGVLWPNLGAQVFVVLGAHQSSSNHSQAPQVAVIHFIQPPERPDRELLHVADDQQGHEVGDGRALGVLDAQGLRVRHAGLHFLVRVLVQPGHGRDREREVQRGADGAHRLVRVQDRAHRLADHVEHLEMRELVGLRARVLGDGVPPAALGGGLLQQAVPVQGLVDLVGHQQAPVLDAVERGVGLDVAPELRLPLAVLQVQRGVRLDRVVLRARLVHVVLPRDGRPGDVLVADQLDQPLHEVVPHRVAPLGHVGLPAVHVRVGGVPHGLVQPLRVLHQDVDGVVAGLVVHVDLRVVRDAAGLGVPLQLQPVDGEVREAEDVEGVPQPHDHLAAGHAPGVLRALVVELVRDLLEPGGHLLDGALVHGPLGALRVLAALAREGGAVRELHAAAGHLEPQQRRGLLPAVVARRGQLPGMEDGAALCGWGPVEGGPVHVIVLDPSGLLRGGARGHHRAADDGDADDDGDDGLAPPQARSCVRCLVVPHLSGGWDGPVAFRPHAYRRLGLGNDGHDACCARKKIDIP